MEHAVYPTPLLVRNALAEPRYWAAWAGFLVGYAGLLLGDSLLPRETSIVPAAALLLFATVVPIVWPVATDENETSGRLSYRRRLIGGAGFVLLALPLWTFAVPRVTVVATVSLFVGAVVAMWVWATLAELAHRTGGIAYLALLVGIVAWLLPSDGELRRFIAVLGAPTAYASGAGVWVTHLLLWSAVGGIGTVMIRRRAHRRIVR